VGRIETPFVYGMKAEEENELKKKDEGWKGSINVK
jgi:hypothetical protein